MPGVQTVIGRLRSEWSQWKSSQSVRFDAMQRQIEDFGDRLDKYDKPVQTPRKDKPRRGPAKPIPVPDRPDVMEAAGVGEDPR